MKKKAFKVAFPNTIPIMAGFLFLGMTYGIYMNSCGFNYIYSLIMGLVVFAGSMQFVACNLLMGSFNPIQALVMTIMINARHIFYGLSMLDKYKGMGFKKIYLIFGLCDETFSVNYSSEIPEDVDKDLYYFFVTILNQSYWVIGSVLGGIFGSFIGFSTEGLDFVLVAMFVVIFLNQWMKDKQHLNFIFGVGVTLIFLLIFGTDNFILPSMAGILFLLTVTKPIMEKEEANHDS